MTVIKMTWDTTTYEDSGLHDLAAGQGFANQLEFCA